MAAGQMKGRKRKWESDSTLEYMVTEFTVSPRGVRGLWFDRVKR